MALRYSRQTRHSQPHALSIPDRPYHYDQSEEEIRTTQENISTQDDGNMDIDDEYGGVCLDLGEEVGPIKISANESIKEVLAIAPIRSDLRNMILQHASNMMVPWQRPEQLLRGITALPGIHSCSDLLFLENRAGNVESVTVISPSALAFKLSCMNIHPSSRYITSVAPVNHSNLFGWVRYAGVSVDHLKVHIVGAELWNRYKYAAGIWGYRALPIIALMASLIACRTSIRSKITLDGLRVFRDVFANMWENMPLRTPITGHNPLLDLLCSYPFPELMPQLRETYVDSTGAFRSQPREGNMFGMRTPIQWQTQIMRARHGMHSPKWGFVV
ncbi:uncharacterized protein BDR25DRAFT_382028 [Lindgomyces ingoldianus]|uniref:Uncharacterized protein n=1 Tax=Lindgomyces ingoldianus TaxID=673940 RepID=A0ACB6R9Q1_9PLEO|nr:uncharacterized protein BDR25DRAFT_382028 [Lindgomyces ingoldianus]KAF2475191.1 hypothetical protein BDR25DRAFT_382028 [Lindgomyces ingoldianus]